MNGHQSPKKGPCERVVYDGKTERTMRVDYFPPFLDCPICGSSRIQPRLKINYWRENALSFSECDECRACFANPMPSSELITRGNEALVKWYQQGRTYEAEMRDARQAYLRGKLLARRLKRIRRRGTLLDVGCYNGFLLLGVKDHCDWTVEGVEISNELSDFIRDKLGITCHNGILEDLQLPANKYDFILCHDLIEHINQPVQFLKEIARILAPQGQIQLITPNALQDLAFAKRAYDRGTPITMVLNHILLFSPHALRIALEKSGLHVRKLYCYDVRYALRDFGVFGLGDAGGVTEGPSMEDALKLSTQNSNQKKPEWSLEMLSELRTHPKVSSFYGFIRETLPRLFQLRVPEKIGVGHEILAIAEKQR